MPNLELMIVMKVDEHTQQIKEIQNCIMADEGRVHREFLILCMRLARIEERLGITWPVVVPGD